MQTERTNVKSKIMHANTAHTTCLFSYSATYVYINALGKGKRVTVIVCNTCFGVVMILMNCIQPNKHIFLLIAEHSRNSLKIWLCGECLPKNIALFVHMCIKTWFYHHLYFPVYWTGFQEIWFIWTEYVHVIITAFMAEHILPQFSNCDKIKAIWIIKIVIR